MGRKKVPNSSHYERNKERYKQNHKKWIENNRERSRELRKAWLQSDEGKFYKYREGAQARNLAFELSRENFSKLLSQQCHYCGKEEARGIDRVDNSQGYTSSNCVPCCKTCNMMKKTMSRKQFIAHIEEIYYHSFVKNL